jgi:thiol:disulfide interchange protein/DsbC/DsbD-like thiol-disulfide interchange protein
MRRLEFVIVAAVAAFAGVGSAFAQSFDDALDGRRSYRDGIIGQFDQSSDIVLNPATVSAQVVPATADLPAVLMIRAKIASGRHTYSITQPAGGPLPTKIQLDSSADYRALGEFGAHPAPNSRIEQGPVWTGLEIQEHEGEVTWFMPIEVRAGIDPAAIEIKGNVHLEVCQKGGYCEPVEQTFTAQMAPDAQLPGEIENELRQSATSSIAAGNRNTAIGEFQAENSAVKFSGQVVPAVVRPGESAQLEFTATLPEGSRIYAYADRDDRLGTKPVLIAIDRASGLVPHRAATGAPVKTDDSVPQFGSMRYHEGTVKWALRVDVPKDSPPGENAITGVLGYQSCEYRDDGKNVCELPQGIRFEANLRVGNEAGEAAAPITFTPAQYSEVARVAATFANFLEGQSTAATATSAERAADDTPVLTAGNQYDLELVQVETDGGSLAYYIALAFVGGLILNLMPCVLPVIGLKVMSFVEQAHRSRAHALVLNLWYAAGIVFVFLLLGVLAATIGLSWGGQFGSTAFNVTIASVVFAMALSLLGVWEVPIPGFFGTGSVQKAAAKEGPLGAFLKGVVTTFLATPCTAPFMVPAIAWAVTQSLATSLVVFASLGIGMASPYLLIGMYPELLRFLPKPGRWMETFKQISGFILLATVVFILSFIEVAATVPTVALLLGIGIACWLIGKTPLTAERSVLLRSWATAGAVILVFVAATFGWLYQDVMQPRFANLTAAARPAGDGPWQPFSLERLKQVAVDGGKTVLVDFSADWCLSCKALELAVLHTDPVERAINESGAITMYADYTKYPPEIARTIRALGAGGVPVIAIFPGDAPYKPLVFGGSYTQQGLIEALEKATGRQLQSAGQSVAEAAPPASSVN